MVSTVYTTEIAYINHIRYILNEIAAVTPSLVLGLHLEPNELKASIRWWLASGGSLCPVCSQKALDPLGNHATTCTHAGDVVTPLWLTFFVRPHSRGGLWPYR